MLAPLCLKPDWPAPAAVQALSTTRQGGISTGGYASLNLGSHVGDDAEAVRQNRLMFVQAAALPTMPAWLNQVHGTAVLDMAKWQGEVETADASFSQQAGEVCLVMTADCLPVLFCNRQGTQVAAAHAGWRGLCDGVLERTLSHFANPADVMVWFGPAIGPGQFEVGADVRAAFMQQQAGANRAFVPKGDGKYLANIYLLARQRLLAAGVSAFYGGEHCTVSEPELFFSYRRDGQTGRMASCIWLDESAISQ